MPTPVESRRLEHQEIARRYRAKRRRYPRPTLAALRVRELERLFSSRYGNELPEDDAGRDDALIAIHHIAACPGNADDNVTRWVRIWAPWLPSGDLGEMIKEAVASPKRWRADRLGWKLRLRQAERDALGIRTIGAFDQGRIARATERRAKNRAAKEAKRRAAGAQPRDQYLASQRATPRPWIELGISRATYFRRRGRTASLSE